MWEIASRAPPFSEYSVAHSQWTSDFEEEIVKGLRPSGPKIFKLVTPKVKKNGATQQLFDMMRICWDERSHIRPTFDQLIPNLVDLQKSIETAGAAHDGYEDCEYENEADNWEEPENASAPAPQYNLLENFVTAISGNLGSKDKGSSQTPQYPLKLSDLVTPEAKKVLATVTSAANPVIPTSLEADLTSPTPTPNPTFPLRLSEILPKSSSVSSSLASTQSGSQINLSEVVGSSEIDLMMFLGTPAENIPQSSTTPVKPPNTEITMSPSQRKKNSTRDKKHSVRSLDKKEVKGKHKKRASDETS